MQIRVTTKVGTTSFQILVDEQKEMEALHKAAVLGAPPDYCPLCKNNEYFSLDSNKDKEGNIYVNVRCKKCQAKAKLGQYKAGGYFWHKFEVYEPKNKQPQQNTTAEAPADMPWED